MTAFDALMPSAQGPATVGANSGRRTASGDWRQAVEHAQLRSWLEGRNTESGPGPQPGLIDQRIADLKGRRDVPAPIVGQHDRGQNSRHSSRQADVGSVGPAPEAIRALPAPARIPLPVTTASVAVSLATPTSASRTSSAHGFDQAAVLTQLASTLGVRTRKQSVHIERGEQGVSVWVRDTRINSQQVNHLAASIAASLGDGSQRLAALYLNGLPVSDFRTSHSHSLSTPSLSE